MKHFRIALLISLLIPCHLLAGEGMWIPSKLEGIVLKLMQEKGCQLTADDIYSVDNPSLKDAVVWFGRGCTGEIISDKGLLLTNYHCGYGQIQSLSSIDNDYLKNGYWAKEQKDELPCKGLSVTFVISIEDITSVIMEKVSRANSEEQRESIVSAISDSMINVRTAGSHYEGFVKSYYYDNQYFLFVTEKYTDIRLVGTPPSSIGKFGGDTDNWVWPRHTGDFAVFRVYAGANNKPSDYSIENVPLKPRYFFPISLKGVNEGDFTMVYGFPANTRQYITSEGVRLAETMSNPAKVEIRRVKLAIMDEAINSNDTIRLMYASKQARIANAYKKWQGEMLGTNRVNTIGRKEKEEKEFESWAARSGNTEFQNVTSQLNGLYVKLTPYHLAYDYTREAIWGVEALMLIKKYFKLEKKIFAEKENSKTLNIEKGKFIKTIQGHFKNYNKTVDQRMFSSLMIHVKKNMAKSFRPDFIEKLPASEKEMDKYIDELFNASIFVDPGKLSEKIRQLNYKSAKLLQGDPLYKIAYSTMNFDEQDIFPQRKLIRDSIRILMRTYMKGLLQKNKNNSLYPDANRSLRVSFGKVEGLEPRDGIHYNYYTSLAGVMEKEKPGDSEFSVPEKLKELYHTKDYGQYGINDTLFTGFIASNHTSGGNSGSPVINANGELVGTNFDRIWEGTMSDIEFDPDRCRNISVDIRYTLFIIDKFAGCTRLIDEMKIVK